MTDVTKLLEVSRYCVRNELNRSEQMILMIEKGKPAPGHLDPAPYLTLLGMERDRLADTLGGIDAALGITGDLPPPAAGMVIWDVMRERKRQQEVEGWTIEHDDEHTDGQMADAAACYARNSIMQYKIAPPGWPWDAKWWKPKGQRRDLVRAAALIVAEIERLDRAAVGKS